MSSTVVGPRGDTRILLICGADQPDRQAWQLLAESTEIGEILVAGHDDARAASLAAHLGGKVVAVRLDSAGSGALTEVLRDVDIVLTCAGTSARFGRDVLSAAIATGTHYLDSCGRWQSTLEMLELDDAACAAGTIAVTGMGISPGTSNLLAVRAMDECDTVDRVVTAQRAPRDAPVRDGGEPIKIWRNGALADAYAPEQLTLTYPGGGAGPAWVCGGPEPLTLPRVRPEVRECLSLVAAAPGLPALFAVAEGRKGGKRIRVGAGLRAVPDQTMEQLTDLPLAIATLMVARGQVAKPGVHGPDGAVDPKSYFAELAELVQDGPVGELVEVGTEVLDD